MKKNIYVSIIGIFLLTIIVSGIMICHHYKEAAEQNDLYDNLVEIVEDSEETLESESEESEATDDTTPFSEYEEIIQITVAHMFRKTVMSLLPQTML